MTNVNDNDMDLGLALSITNQCVQPIWNSSNTGAGANANSTSRVDMTTLVGSDPLTELVWSPQTGLSLKCAGSSSCFADRKPCFLWDAGPSNMGSSPSHSIRSGNSKDEKRVSQSHSIVSRATCHVDSEVAKCTSSAKSPRSSASDPLFGLNHGHTGTGEKIGEMDRAVRCIDMEDSNKGKEKMCLSSSKSTPIGNVAETSESGPQNHRTADLLLLLGNETERTSLFAKVLEDGTTPCEGKTDDIGSGSNVLGCSNVLPLKVPAATKCMREERPLPDLLSMRKKLEKGKEKMKEYGSSDASSSEKLEATAENGVLDPVGKYAILENCQPSSSDSRMRGEDRGKSLSCRKSNEKDEDNSHGSMESCNSANLLSKGKRRWSYDRQLILGSKRIKKQTQESTLSTSLVKQDSSFMNWISNMVKGLGKSKEEGRSLGPGVGHPINDHENCDQDLSIFKKTAEFGRKKLGFQTVFQSLYSPDVKAHETRTHIDNKPIRGCKEIVLADETHEAVPTGVSHRGQINNIEQTTVGYEEDKSIHACTNVTKNGSSSLNSSHGVKMAKTVNCAGNTSDPRGSLWVTRLYPKTPSNQLNSSQSDHRSLEARDTLTNDASGSVGFKKIGEEEDKNPVGVTSETLKSPEEMASIFARRLDAFRHIKPTTGQTNAAQTKTCVFCGRTGHGITDCLEIKENELEGLLRNVSYHEGMAEEIPCLCIKCFQPNHWASTCPFSSNILFGTGNKRCFSMIVTKESPSEFGGSCSLGKRRIEADVNFKMKENGNVSSGLFQRGIFRKDKLNEEKYPLCTKPASKQTLEAPKAMFDTIRKLRLSRTDIIKWANSHFPVAQLDGFFLRLRLAKLEEGLGGAGYYVACIAGSQGEKPSKGSKKPIRVNVGGVECLVESQYVSNCDFLEEELIAWWQKASRIGQIPMEEDLKSKLEERRKLGL